MLPVRRLAYPTGRTISHRREVEEARESLEKSIKVTKRLGEKIVNLSPRKPRGGRSPAAGSSNASTGGKAVTKKTLTPDVQTAREPLTPNADLQLKAADYSKIESRPETRACTIEAAEETEAKAVRAPKALAKTFEAGIAASTPTEATGIMASTPTDSAALTPGRVSTEPAESYSRGARRRKTSLTASKMARGGIAASVALGGVLFWVWPAIVESPQKTDRAMMAANPNPNPAIRKDETNPGVVQLESIPKANLDAMVEVVPKDTKEGHAGKERASEASDASGSAFVPIKLFTQLCSKRPPIFDRKRPSATVSQKNSLENMYENIGIEMEEEQTRGYLPRVSNRSSASSNRAFKVQKGPLDSPEESRLQNVVGFREPQTFVLGSSTCSERRSSEEKSIEEMYANLELAGARSPKAEFHLLADGECSTTYAYEGEPSWFQQLSYHVSFLIVTAAATSFTSSAYTAFWREMLRGGHFFLKDITST